jgi:hypothetical protein
LYRFTVKNAKVHARKPSLTTAKRRRFALGITSGRGATSQMVTVDGIDEHKAEKYLHTLRYVAKVVHGSR